MQKFSDIKYIYALISCANNVANCALLRCKIFSVKIRLCKNLDKYQRVGWGNETHIFYVICELYLNLYMVYLTHKQFRKTPEFPPPKIRSRRLLVTNIFIS